MRFIGSVKMLRECILIMVSYVYVSKLVGIMFGLSLFSAHGSGPKFKADNDQMVVTIDISKTMCLNIQLTTKKYSTDHNMMYLVPCVAIRSPTCIRECFRVRIAPRR